MTLENLGYFQEYCLVLLRKLTKITTKLVPKQSNTNVGFLNLSENSTSAGIAEVLMGIILLILIWLVLRWCCKILNIIVKNLLLEEFDFNVICKAYDYLNHFLFLHCFFYNDRAKETEGTMSSFSSSTSTSTYDVNPSSIFRKSWGQSGLMKLTTRNGTDTNRNTWTISG